ncbi:hypothetical protein N4G70_35875 [Streptomyces sp. ASQP_92]|uniref:hypothetical protein n=1 Tax=Streptomyces sp. ASQP_92 TaxID=2979116 RepID=UPI0021C05958|nr:hypothetical protein [Streptomyces sp. ASQP_92]MCT9094181.1 hypothetical protein [Streptomyces sp. ASQP_92]
MDTIPCALDGYLTADPVPGARDGTVVWRLSCSSTADHMEEEAVIPCTASQPDIVHALLTERQPGDLLRVTGRLTLPVTANGIIQLHAETLEVLWAAPLLDPDEDDAGDTATVTDPETDRNSAIAALAESLASLAHQAAPGPGQNIRLHISPTGTLGSGLEHCHSIDLTPARARQLADGIDAMNCFLDCQRPCGDVPDPQTIAELTDLFDSIDLVALTGAVLNATRPEHRLRVTEAMDAMFGDAPAPEDTDP